VAEVIRHLPPEVKRGVKAALRAVAADPTIGQPLRGDLQGLMKFRVRRYRLVYAVERRQRAIRVFAVGHRRGIYEQIAAQTRPRARSVRASDRPPSGLPDLL
jgi:mRNA interferase RelE/StbE